MTLVFDTETSGKADFNAPPEAPHQPRLVQLGAVMLDSDLNEVACMNLVIKPIGFTISDEVAKIHGITQAMAERYGCSEHAALILFRDWLMTCDTMVAHNIRFDGIVIGRAFAVESIKVDKMPQPYCTMQATTNLCKLPGDFGVGYKWPKLVEAHKQLLGWDFTGVHDALNDVRACARLYKFLIRGVKTPAPSTVPEVEIMREYDDNTLMPFGKCKGIPLGKLPKSYCSWLYGQESLSDRALYRWLHGTKPAAKYMAPEAPESCIDTL